MIALFGGLADGERDLIRTAERRSRSQKRGQHMGRPLKPHRRIRARGTAVERAEDAALAELARSYAVRKSAISRLNA